MKTLVATTPLVAIVALALTAAPARATDGDAALDAELQAVLAAQGFTGRIQETLATRLGHAPDTYGLGSLGRLLFFDTLTGLNDDNTCAGCHAPSAGFGDTQRIAIGIDNNGIVGPHRAGPRNQRRTPSIVNTAFYPTLMWNSRFASGARDPFDNSLGFSFPAPEGDSLSWAPHLLVAQAHIPPTERVEAAGFAFPGDNAALRDEVVRRLNATPAYRATFAKYFPSVAAGGAISYPMFASALAEFEYTQTYAYANLDRFARGNRWALTSAQKRGALLFFGKAGCAGCHATSGDANEMFSDFREHVIAVPQIVPVAGASNMIFDGPAADEDHGLAQVTGDPDDRYAFRTSPLRNVALQPAFFHNGSATTLEEAIHHHLDPAASLAAYTGAALPADLVPASPQAMTAPLARLDPLLAAPIVLSATEEKELVDFVRNGLTDSRATREELMKLVPTSVPSGRPVLTFE